MGGLNSRVIETVLVMSSGLPGKGVGDLQVSHLEKTGTTGSSDTHMDSVDSSRPEELGPRFLIIPGPWEALKTSMDE